MTRFPQRLRYGLPILAAFVAGCGWFGGGSPLSSNDTLLRYVPADTPYVFATLEPLPDPIWDAYTKQLESLGNLFRLGIENAMAELGNINAAGGSPFGNPGANQEALQAIADLTSAETLESMGIDRDSTYAFYGLGLLPVFRITLAEGHDMAGVLDRIESLIESQGDATVATGSVGGQEYRSIGADQARFIVALLENELVASVVPANFGDAELQAVLGVALPEQSIADTGRLEEIADEYGFTSHMAAMLDVERITAIFLDSPSATDSLLFDLMDYDAGEISAICRDEIRNMAGVAPSIVSGYTSLDDRSMEMSLVFELRNDIAAGLARIPTPVRGIGAETDALFAFGMSFDIEAARDFVAARLAAIQADPFECEYFAEMNEGIPEAQMYLNQPLPPFVDGIRGFSATMDFSDFDFAAGAPMPSDLAVSLLLSTSDAAGALMMASMLDPQIASLNLPTDGQIVEVDLPPPFNDPSVNPFGQAYFVASDEVIGIGLGRNGETRLSELMQSPPGDPSTFLNMSVDMSAYYGLLADMMENAALIDPSGVPPTAVISSMTDVMRSLQALYSRETVDIRFTERGVEIPIRLDLAP